MNADRCAQCGRGTRPASGDMLGVILVTEAWAMPSEGLRTVQTALCSHVCLLTWAATMLADLTASLNEQARLEYMAALTPREERTP